MDRNQIQEWLQGIARGELSPDEVMQKLTDFPYLDLGYAKVDFHRQLRNGNAEVIYCPGKTATQITRIFQSLAEVSPNVMATRAGKRVYHQIQQAIPETTYFEAARVVALWRDHRQTEGIVGVITAGTADLKMAEEAAVTVEILGSRVRRIYDVGVAGIHRLFDQKTAIEACRVLIVVAGMDGALASVIGGLVSKPVIAVPTSVGYGTNFQGMAPLLSMLNSCASGVAVVNIDNGFGAGVLAHRINRLGEKE